MTEDPKRVQESGIGIFEVPGERLRELATAEVERDALKAERDALREALEQLANLHGLEGDPVRSSDVRAFARKALERPE